MRALNVYLKVTVEDDTISDEAAKQIVVVLTRAKLSKLVSVDGYDYLDEPADA